MIGKNTVFGIVASAVQIGTRFITIPVVIYHLGLGGYGIWSIIMATAGYMRFGSAGIKSAFQKYVAEATGTGDFDTANKLLSTGSISMLLLSLAGLIPIAIFSQKLAVVSGVPPEFLFAASKSITLLAVIMLASNFGAVFESVVMGGHRIDLTRTFSIFTTTGEAIAIVTLLYFGHGLFAMSATIAASEIIYVSCCFVASRRIVPQMHIRLKYFTHSVFPELIRYAGSYQLVNVLELFYAMLLPVTVLKYCGAETAGVYSIVLRVVAAALIAEDALILPILSGGTVMLASGSSERIGRFFKKSFKATLAVTLAPLAFVAVFGTILIFAWTGQTGPEFRTTLWLMCLAGLFQSISRLQLILYRASGHALHDNIRQAFRLAVLVVLAFFGGVIGFYGILAVLAVAEFLGVVYMFFAMTSALGDFRPKDLVPDAMRLTAATLLLITAGIAVAMTPAPWAISARMIAAVKLGEVSLACLIAFLPAIVLTRSATVEEQGTVLGLLCPWRKTATVANE